MEEWDQATLEKVVESKKNEYNQNKPTDIVCKYFLDAVEKKQYGWFWACPNGGKECHYRHALPPGYILKSQMKALLEEESQKMPVEEEIENERAKLKTATQMTPALFMEWKRKKIAERDAGLAASQAERAKNDRMSGRELFLSNASLFVDDAEAFEEYQREKEEEEIEQKPSRFSKERTERRTFLDSPGSKFLKRSHESYTEVDHGLQIEKKRAISWPENSIATNHVHYCCIPRDPQDFNFPFSYPKEPVYRPPLLTQKTFISFPVEETLDSSLHFRNYNSPSLGYHGEDIGYSSEALLPHDHREPSSALLLEWNTESASTRKTDDLQPSNHTELITCPNASSSLADNPWRSDYSSSHDVVTRELYPLPLLSHYTSGSFLLPATNQTRHFEHELERHMIDDEDVVAANQNLQTFHHATSSSDCLTRGHTYYHSPSNSPLDHSPFKSPGREMVSFPFSSISNSDLLEESSPTTQSDRWWI
ncbi:hypothetical protein F2Q68_00019331 [Brassica cretica]|uniref:C3H1-type domain-containing protein n=1 Tax=Brassica cretica TaxID=69181 RepID=A0A8S9FS74_BRACR|nr:hypothetical protein F2Q68_00019331 [Brassica cretica]